jgi:hypothetical protein
VTDEQIAVFRASFGVAGNAVVQWCSGAVVQSRATGSMGIGQGAYWFETAPSLPARPGYANRIDYSAKRHYTEECQPT